MNKLKELRESKLLTQSKIAESIGITTSYYGMIEAGVRIPSLPIAFKIAGYFNMPIEKIFCPLEQPLVV